MKNEGRNSDGAGIHLLRRNAEVGNMPIEEHAVNWEGPGSPCPRLRLLLLSDVDLASAGRVVEWTIEEDIAFDLCIVCGDFISRSGGFAAAAAAAADDAQEEKLSTEEGEMSAILAQLENTVCRVVYIPGPFDPLIPSVRAARRKASAVSRAKRAEESGSGGGIGNTEGRARRRGLGGALGVADPERWVGKAIGVESEGYGGGVNDGRCWDDHARVSQLQLTPTSKNLFRRTLRLAPGLSAAGFTQELRMENVPCPVVTGAPNDELAPPVTPSSFNVGERRAGKGGIAWNLDLSGDEGGDSGDLSGYYSPELSGKDASTEFFMSETGTLFAVEEAKAGSGGVAWQLEVVGDGDGVDTPDNGENIIPFLRTLCRPRTHAARASAIHPSAGSVDAIAREEKGIHAALKRSPVWTLSNSNAATSSSSYAESDPDPDPAASSSRVAVQDDSMILLTRTGGPLSCNNDSGFAYYGGVCESGDVNNIAGIRGQKANLEKEMEFAMVRAQENLEVMAAARLLRRLWAQEASRKRRRSVSAAADVGTDMDGGTERGGLLLHVCAGPGAARAVREMLASGQASTLDSLSAEEAPPLPSPPGGTVNGSINTLKEVKAKLELEERMPAKGGGLGCRIGDFTVVALGSLREEGAHCVVELGFPENLEGVSVRGKGDTDVREWSVASVRFGRVGVPSVGERAALAHEYSSRGGDQGFIVNFD